MLAVRSAFKVKFAQGWRYKYYTIRVGNLQRLKGDSFEHSYKLLCA